MDRREMMVSPSSREQERRVLSDGSPDYLQARPSHLLTSFFIFLTAHPQLHRHGDASPRERKRSTELQSILS